MADFSRQNNATKATVQMDGLFAEGAFKNVYKGKYTQGDRAGQECVAKLFKSGSVFKEEYFNNELKVVKKAVEIVNDFNRKGIINMRIWVNIPCVWTFEDCDREGEKCLVEPMIENFRKFNSNTGWTPDEVSSWSLIMQALSHYSFHFSNCQVLFCDLQGGIQKEGFVISDPVIMSINKEYGPTDLGSKGISTFFSRHKCNKFCDKGWKLPSEKKTYFTVKQGTSMMLSNVAAPVSNRIDSGYGSMNQLPELVEELDLGDE